MKTRTALPRLACALLLGAAGARAANELPCSAEVFAALGRQVKTAHFAPGLNDFGTDPSGVILASACKRMPNDPRLMLAAAAWDAGKADEKSLVLALVDEASSTIVAAFQGAIDEDAATQVNNGSLRLDTAAYELAPGVRAVGLDISSDEHGCGDGTLGPTRSLYVRDGKALRPVVAGLSLNPSWYLRGNQRRCVSDPQVSETAITEDVKVTIALGAPGKGGWRDLMMTAAATRSDHEPARKPLHLRVPYDGDAYPMVLWVKAFAQWRK